MIGKHKRLSDRAFGLAFAGLFLLIFVVGSAFFAKIRLWALSVSASFAFMALIAPGTLMPLNRLWMLATERLNAVLNLALMLVSYVVVILPLGLMMKLRGRDALRLNLPAGQETYWVPPARQITQESFQDLF